MLKGSMGGEKSEVILSILRELPSAEAVLSQDLLATLSSLVPPVRLEGL